MADKTRCELTCEAIARAGLGEPVRREGDELLWRCPHGEMHEHGDFHPSLMINTKKNVWACWPCDMKGRAWALAAFVACLRRANKPAVSAWLREHGLLDGGAGLKHRVAKQRVAVYSYGLNLRKVRLEPGESGKNKTFVWEHLEGGTWKLGDGGTKDKPLYVNEAFRQRDQIEFVIGVEGEGKVDLAGELGYPAFSFKDLTEAQCSVLAGLEIILWPDKDQSGSKQCQDAALVALVSGQPRTIRVIAPPQELPDRGDIVDAVRTLGWGREQVDRLVRDAAPFQPMGAEAEMKPGAVLRCFSNIAPEELKWLWPGRIPLGKLTLLVGDPGVGKSMVTVDIAYRVTRGAAFPDGTACEPGIVILLSAEDDPADTIRPRLDAAGADVSRVHLLEAVRVPLPDGSLGEKSFNLETDVARLEEIVQQHPDVRAIGIDPITAYMGGTDSHNNAQVRGILAPLAAFAARHHVAIVGVTHMPKSRERAVHSVIGSIGFVAAARAAWMVVQDPEDAERRLFLPVKQNLAPNIGGLAFRIEGADGVPHLAWESGTVSLTADDVLGMQEERQPRRKRREATEWLSELLAKGPLPQKEVESAAKAAGLKWRTVRDAADDLNICRRKDGFAGGWIWSLPNSAAEDAVPPFRKNGTFDNVAENKTHETVADEDDAPTNGIFEGAVPLQHDGTFDNPSENTKDNDAFPSEDAVIGGNGTFAQGQAEVPGDDGLTCPRCGHHEGNLTAAHYHFEKLCPRLGRRPRW